MSLNSRGCRIAVALVVLLSTGTAFAADPASPANPTKKQCVEANESGQDLRRSGKLQDARAALAICTARSCPRPVREDCAQRLTELEAAIPTLVLAAKDAEGHDLSAVHVTIDGRPLVDTLDGSALAIDPGEHHFAFEAEGLGKSEITVVVREGDKERRVLVALEAPRVEAPTPVAAPAKALAPAAGSNASTLHNVGLGLAVAGAAGLIFGGVFAILADVTYQHALSDECGGIHDGCSQQGASDSQTAQTEAAIATVAIPVGAALIAGGAALYFTTASGPVVLTPTASDRAAGLSLSGRW